ncbi:MAG: patatin-like phospholipase family protein [Bacteroidia bacterium]
MSKITPIWTAIRYSLPSRLLVIQLRKYKLLLLFWGVLLGIISGKIGEGLGFPYLFLEPEYLGEEGFLSLLIIGCTLGAFIFAYMVTLYINESYRFPFIIRHRHPFIVFSINNLVLPLILLSVYMYTFVAFHLETEQTLSHVIVDKVLGLFSGMGLTFLLFSIYFFAIGRKSFLRKPGAVLEREIERARGGEGKKLLLKKARQSFRRVHRVDSYFTSPFSIAKPALGTTPFRKVIHILNRNHGNLLLLQLGVFLFILVLAWLEASPAFNFPAGATIVLMLTLMMTAAGAITFWFRKIGVVVLLAVIALIAIFDRLPQVHEQHQAVGLDYSQSLSPYNQTHVDSLSQSFAQADSLAGIAMLEAWKARYMAEFGHRPKAVFISTSGGGLRSAFWTTLVLQGLDSMSDQRLTAGIRLYTGASGGMIGAAYFRELAMRRSIQSLDFDLSDAHYQRNISRDLLNRIAFRLFTDAIVPNRRVERDGMWYDYERGLAFDRQLQLNLPELAGRKLGHYAAAEQAGIIGPMVLTPAILNQGVKLYISSNSIAYLAERQAITPRFPSKAHGIEFRRMFAQHRPDSLSIASALRMNATFPLVLPVVELPSEPTMMVMDAGAIDNYGVQTAVSYLFNFRSWFAENTDGVIFIQIRDNSRHDPILDLGEGGFLARSLAPVDGGYGAIIESKDMGNDLLLESMKEWFTGPLEIISFEYPQETSDRPATISLHLTQREKKSILRSLYTTHNERSFQTIRELYH